MSSDCRLIVFSDLDGTLIDHESYDWRSARDALSALKRISAGLVLASSKTAAEISVLRAELGTQDWPAIAENGAGVLPPFVTEVPDDGQYERLRAALDSVPMDLRRQFTGFGDATIGEVAQMTGLTRDVAILAQKRCFSEPGQWSGTDDQKTAFLEALGKQGVGAQQGGRFLTLSFGQSKADQMRTIIDTYAPRHTIALGDAPNDIAMLEAADFGVIIANPHHPPLPPLKGEANARISRTKEAGPLGWNKAILDFIERLDLR